MENNRDFSSRELDWRGSATRLQDMRTSLKPYETTGIIAGALVFLGACIIGGVALGTRGCCRRKQVPMKAADYEPLEANLTSRVTAIQLARELAYQKAVSELEDYFEHDSKAADEAAHVKKTLDFLQATLNAIG